MAKPFDRDRNGLSLGEASGFFLCNIDNEASGWVSSEPLIFDASVTISTNSGFGGVNCAVVLKKW
jgi:3-oxoacyl-(acyl-carrier-protein) synthase